MTEENKEYKHSRKSRSLEEEIAATADKLRKLQELQKQQKRKERERNQKAVMELIQSERLEAVPAEIWREALPEIKALLLNQS